MCDDVVAEAEPVRCQCIGILDRVVILTSSLYHAETISPCSSLRASVLITVERLPILACSAL